SFFLDLALPPPSSTLFPYTTLFRSEGYTYGLIAYGLWGLVPLYFHALDQVSPMEILAHRIVWSLLFLALVLSLTHRWGMFQKCLDRKSTRLNSSHQIISYAVLCLKK